MSPAAPPSTAIASPLPPRLEALSLGVASAPPSTEGSSVEVPGAGVNTSGAARCATIGCARAGGLGKTGFDTAE